jgi:hypothetical protein
MCALFVRWKGRAVADEMDDGGEDSTITLTSTPEEIDADVGDVVTVQVEVVKGAFPYFRSTYKRRAMLALTTKQG